MEYPENLAYLHDKQIELLKNVRRQKVVFLDMNHWNWIRKVHINGTDNQEDKILYDKILSSRGNVIYPIEFGILMETLKQSDPVSFSKTIEVMDLLSDSVAIIPHDERQFVESWMYFGNPTRGKDPDFIRQYPVFTKATMIGGSKIPVIEKCGREWNRIAQKAFIDYVWDIGLRNFYDMVEFNIDGSAAAKIPKFDDLADMVNKFNEKYADVYASWEQLIDIEMQGAIDITRKHIESGMAYLYWKNSGRWPSPQEFKHEEGKGIQNFVYGLFKHGCLPTQFPYIQVSANIFASIRWNKTGKMTGNDQYDIGHATCALPYCDAFFTDKKTVFHITNGNTKLNQRYRCFVSAKLSDIYTVL